MIPPPPPSCCALPPSPPPPVEDEDEFSDSVVQIIHEFQLYLRSVRPVISME